MANDTRLLKQRILSLLPETQAERSSELSLCPLTPDGSNRRFYRFSGQQVNGVVILPPEEDAAGRNEAASAQSIGQHLASKRVPVPEIFAYDPADGLLLVENLGDQRLYDIIMAHPDQRELLYHQVVTNLARMQVKGAEGFNTNWCYDTPCYDVNLMLERESGYFLKVLCKDLLELHFDPLVVEKEFQQLASLAAAAPAEYFLHRDFQSRNIMIKDGAVRIIDYQGGRLGPLAYDLASLLIDPYASLPADLQTRLVESYLDVLQGYIPYEREQFLSEYHLLAMQRNLQILGAFAFLSSVRKKEFFTDFIVPALDSLLALLAKPERGDYPAIRNLAEQCRLQLEKHP